MNKKRLKEAEETGAKTVVSACPLCKVNLTKAAKEMGSPLNVIDINELIIKTI